MGFARRVVRKSVRRATPRSVRKDMHPVRTKKNAVTPRPLKQASRAIYTVTNPIGAAENALIGSVLYAGSGSSRRRSSSGTTRRSPAASRTAARTGPTATERRRAEGAAAHGALEHLMTVGREKFRPLPHPTVDGPPKPNLQGIINAEWRACRKQVSFWDRAGRTGLRESIIASVRAYGESHHQWALRAVGRQQAVADAWWKSLQDGDRDVLQSVLVAAFSDNPAPVTVARAEGSTAVLLFPSRRCRSCRTVRRTSLPAGS